MASQKESKDKHDAAENEDKQQKAKSEADTKGDSADMQGLDSLLSALEGDLTAIDHDTALGLIDQWHGSLHKSKEPEIKEISTGLKELKQLLKGGKATGHEISEVLVEIGEQTIHVASDADKELKTPLQKLGKQLTKAGTSLGKAEDREHVEHIDSLVETLEAEDLASVDTGVTTNAIDEWYALLHKSEDENLKEIANGLKELKQILKRSKATGPEIGAALTKLGEQTTTAANEAGRGLKGPVKKLGKILSKVGKSLE